MSATHYEIQQCTGPDTWETVWVYVAARRGRTSYFASIEEARAALPSAIDDFNEVRIVKIFCEVVE